MDEASRAVDQCRSAECRLGIGEGLRAKSHQLMLIRVRVKVKLDYECRRLFHFVGFYIGFGGMGISENFDPDPVEPYFYRLYKL